MASAPNTSKSQQKKKMTKHIRDSGSESSDAPDVQNPTRTRNNKKRKAPQQRQSRASAPVRLRTLETDLMIRHEALMNTREKKTFQFFKQNKDTADTSFLAFSFVAEFMVQHFMFRESAALCSTSAWLNDCVSTVHHNRRCLLVGLEAPGDLLLARAEYTRQLISIAKKAEEDSVSAVESPDLKSLEPDSHATGSYTLVLFADSLALTNIKLMRKQLKLNWLTSKFIESLVIVGRNYNKNTPSVRIGAEFAEEISQWGSGVKRIVFQNVFANPDFYEKLTPQFCVKLEFFSYKDVAQRGFGALQRSVDDGAKDFEKFCRLKFPALTEIQIMKSTVPSMIISKMLGSCATAMQVSNRVQDRIEIEAFLDLGAAPRTAKVVFDMCFFCHIMPSRWSKLQSLVVDAQNESEDTSNWIFEFFKSSCVNSLQAIFLSNCSEDYVEGCQQTKNKALSASPLRGLQRRQIKQVNIVSYQTFENN